MASMNNTPEAKVQELKVESAVGTVGAKKSSWPGFSGT